MPLICPSIIFSCSSQYHCDLTLPVIQLIQRNRSINSREELLVPLAAKSNVILLLFISIRNARGLRGKSEIIKVYDDWRNEVNKDTGNSLKPEILKMRSFFGPEFKERHKAFLEKIRIAASEGNDLKCRRLQDEWERLREIEEFNFEEQLGAFTDCLQAALEGHDSIRPRGHEKTYFMVRDNQLAEFFAHCSENYWSGNPYFEQIAPSLYKLMRNFIKYQ